MTEFYACKQCGWIGWFASSSFRQVVNCQECSGIQMYQFSISEVVRMLKGWQFFESMASKLGKGYSKDHESIA